MFEDDDGDTLAVFNLGGRGASFPVPELPPQLSRPTSPVSIPPAKAAASARHRVSAEPVHAVLDRSVGEGPMQIKRSSSAAAAARAVPQIKRSSSSVVRAEMNRHRDIAVADAQRRGIKAKAWDAYPGGVMLELSDSDTDTEDETEPETDLQKAARNLSRDGAVVHKLFTEEEIERYRHKLL